MSDSRRVGLQLVCLSTGLVLGCAEGVPTIMERDAGQAVPDGRDAGNPFPDWDAGFFDDDDAGSPFDDDAGSPGVDAGAPPVGVDAGAPPVGMDAGAPPVGMDAGPPPRPDAGPPPRPDAGPPPRPDAGPPPRPDAGPVPGASCRAVRTCIETRLGVPDPGTRPWGSYDNVFNDCIDDADFRRDHPSLFTCLQSRGGLGCWASDPSCDGPTPRDSGRRICVDSGGGLSCYDRRY